MQSELPNMVVQNLIEPNGESTVATVLRRIWQMTAGGLQAGIRDGMLHWAIATVYREMLMPLLQIGALLGIGYAWLTKAARPQSGT
jgi:hypothetical protein